MRKSSEIKDLSLSRLFGLGKIDFCSHNQLLCFKDQVNCFLEPKNDKNLIELFKKVGLY